MGLQLLSEDENLEVVQARPGEPFVLRPGSGSELPGTVRRKAILRLVSARRFCVRQNGD
jgi:hypothetical protein